MRKMTLGREHVQRERTIDLARVKPNTLGNTRMIKAL
jgi:hypothetical protein